MRMLFRIVVLYMLLFVSSGGPVYAASDIQSGIRTPDSIRQITEKAQNGDIQAQVRLGEIYAKGKGVKTDYRKAAMWWERSANSGDRLSQYRLGVLYSRNKSPVHNDKKAVKWFQKAADQGDAFAQYNLGVKYAKGNGIARDYSTAMRLWEKSAMQGNKYAQYNLGLKLYKGGDDIKKDNIRAYAWLKCAAAQGVDKAVRFVSEIENKSSDDVLNEAIDLSKTYMLVYAGEQQ